MKVEKENYVEIIYSYLKPLYHICIVYDRFLSTENE